MGVFDLTILVLLPLDVIDLTILVLLPMGGVIDLAIPLSIKANQVPKPLTMLISLVWPLEPRQLRAS